MQSASDRETGPAAQPGLLLFAPPVPNEALSLGEAVCAELHNRGWTGSQMRES